MTENKEPAAEPAANYDGEEYAFEPEPLPAVNSNANKPAARTYTAEDGTVFEWNAASNMWLPQVDEELMRKQQEAYGGTPSEPTAAPPKKRKYNNKKKQGDQPEVVENPNDLYVEGLPPDVTMEDFVEYFSKAGIVRKDPETGVIKAKIYKTPEGHVKGDGLICYLKQESVNLALSILDGAEYKKGYPLKLSVAKFVNKPELKRKKKKNNKKARGGKKVDQNKDLGWDENENRHVVIKKMFDPKEAVDDESFFMDLKEDITSECAKFGDVDKVSIFEFNPEGVVVIKFKDGIGSAKCLEVMNGRFFAGKKLEAEYYDGTSNYHVEESDEMKQKRSKKWESWLDGSDEEEEKNT